MRIVFGADDDAPTVAAVLERLRESDHEVTVVDADLPWPSIAHRVATAVADGEADAGVVLCWTGTGTSIASVPMIWMSSRRRRAAWP